MRFLCPLFVSLVSLVALPACQRPADAPPDASSGSAGVAEGHDAHAHDHAAEGPHGGHLVVLGDEAYHAEWLHDDATGLVTVFLLAGDGKSDVRTAAGSLVIEVAIAGNVRQHALQPVDRDQQVPPMASRFEIQDKPLVEALKAAGQGVDATVVVDIAGAPHRGKIEHHEHADGHGHAH